MKNTMNTLSNHDLELVCGGNTITGGSRPVVDARSIGSQGDFGLIDEPAPNREELETHVG